MQRRSAALAAVLSLFLFAIPGAAQAQLFRAYLSISGSDGNPCTLVAPCRLLPAALNAVVDGGEVWTLDSGNFNTSTVNVTKSVTILAVPGTVGSVVAAGATGMTVNAPGGKVTLRNLVLVPLATSPGAQGVVVNSVDSLIVEGCVFANFGQYGISTTTPTKITVVDTQFRSIGSAALNVQNGATATVARSTFSDMFYAIFVYASAPSTTTSVEVLSSTFINGDVGVMTSSAANATATARASVRDSTISGFTGSGVLATGSVGKSEVTVASSTLSANNVGARAFGAGAWVAVANNIITGNTTGLSGEAGTVESLGGNTLRRNGTSKNGTVTTTAPE